jgi:hypothetical protein
VLCVRRCEKSCVRAGACSSERGWVSGQWGVGGWVGGRGRACVRARVHSRAVYRNAVIVVPFKQAVYNGRPDRNARYVKRIGARRQHRINRGTSRTAWVREAEPCKCVATAVHRVGNPHGAGWMSVEEPKPRSPCVGERSSPRAGGGVGERGSARARWRGERVSGGRVNRVVR